MVDAAQQGKGYGRAAMEAIIARLVVEPDCHEVLLDYEPENEPARRLYASLGFREIETDSDGAIVASLDVTQRRAAKHTEPPDITFDATISDDDAEYLHRQIRVFNASHSEPHRLARLPEHAPQSLQIFVRDADGTVLGGIAGSTYWAGWRLSISGWMSDCVGKDMARS